MNIAQVSDPLSPAPAARVVEKFTAAIVAERIRAAVAPIHAAAKVAMQAVMKESDARTAPLKARMEDLSAQLKHAEEMGAAHLGVHPVAGEAIEGRDALAGSPAATLSQWRSLTGKARSAFFGRGQNQELIWQGLSQSEQSES
jgi:hypothetical protein